MCPRGGRLLNPEGRFLEPVDLISHCLLIESSDGLVLVDSGFGMADIADPLGRLGRLASLGLRPKLDPAQTALRQVERLGFSASDVRHIVVTHMDFDHVGGLSDFPRARVHVNATEFAAATARATEGERMRYHDVQWAHGPDWAEHATQGELWFGFEAVRPIEGLDPEVVMIPLVGHTRGHTGVAVRDRDGWLLHAGDAYFFHGEMDPDGARCPVGLRLFQHAMAVDSGARLKNRARLRALAREHRDDVTIFCAHDMVELKRAGEPPAASP